MSREWACAVTKPGTAALPVASITWWASPGHSLIGPTASMTAPRTATKPSSMTRRAGSIVTTRALRMSSVLGIATQSTRTQHVAQSLDRAAERVLGRGGEADDDAIAVRDLLAGQWMAHPRKALQCGTAPPRPCQHRVLAAVGQVQQHVHACGQTADPDIESGERVDEGVASSPVTRAHPADVAGVVVGGNGG